MHVLIILFVDSWRHLAQKVLLETHIIIQKSNFLCFQFFLEHRNIFTYFIAVFLLGHLPVWSFNSIFYQWGIINFDVLRQTSEVLKTSNRYNKYLYNTPIYKNLQNVTFRRGLLSVVCFVVHGEIWSLPDSKAHSPSPYFYIHNPFSKVFTET